MRWIKNISLILLIAVAAHAAEKRKFDSKFGSDLPFLKGAMIEIKSWDEKTHTYLAASPAFPGEGDSYITPEGLKKGVDAINLERILQSPKSIIGNQYKTDHELPTLNDDERVAREKRK
jgi:hypothetical protein